MAAVRAPIVASGRLTLLAHVALSETGSWLQEWRQIVRTFHIVQRNVHSFFNRQPLSCLSHVGSVNLGLFFTVKNLS